MKNEILKVENLIKQFENKTIIDNISITVNKGDVYGLLGPNGSGKTTFLKTIVGVLISNKGKICIRNFDISKDRENAFSKIGGIIEYPIFYENLTGYKNLLLFGTLNNTSKKIIDETLDLVGLSEYKNKKVKTYSLGMKQKLGIARALLNKPDIVILDEPTNGLDATAINDFKNLIINLSKNQEVSFLISSHILSELEVICNRIGIIYNGRIVNEVYMEDIYDETIETIEIYTTNIKEIFNSIKKYDWIKNVETTSNGVIITIIKKHYNQFIKYLNTENIAFEYLSPIKRTLEDYYLEKIKG